MRHLTQVDAVAQQSEQEGLVDDLAVVSFAGLRGPYLGGVPLDLQFAYQLRGRSGFRVARKDVPDQCRLWFVDDEFAVPHVIA